MSKSMELVIYNGQKMEELEIFTEMAAEKELATLGISIQWGYYAGEIDSITLIATP